MKINIWISKVLLRFVSSLLKVSSKQNTERCDHISFFYSIRSKNFSRSSELAFAFVCMYVRSWIYFGLCSHMTGIGPTPQTPT